MVIQNIKKISFYLRLVLALSTGLAMSACSTESTNKTIQYSIKSFNKDDSKDFKALHSAATQSDPQAQFQLGVMYENGEGVSQDKSKAAWWYRKSVEQGFADGQNALAKLYYFNMELEPVFNESIAWFEKAAAQGQPEAQFYIGFFYEKDSEITKDYDQSLKWYLKSAENGFATAQFRLGTMYYYGEGVKRDYKQAKQWYQKAADQGDMEAQYNIGVTPYGRIVVTPKE